MIEKLTDIGELSGDQSPLLPLIYCDFYTCINETDGVYIQTVEGEKALLFSLRNSTVTVSRLSDKYDSDEFMSFVNFTHTTHIIGDFMFSDRCEEFRLMSRKCDAISDDGFFVITPDSSVSEYRNIHSLLGEDGDDFGSWYIAFSRKVNSRNAVAVYTEDFRSCAVCTAVAKGVGVIAGVYTDREYRGMGYGKKAVEGLVYVLNGMNVSSALLWCTEENVSFYEKSGFSCIGKLYGEVI